MRKIVSAEPGYFFVYFYADIDPCPEEKPFIEKYPIVAWEVLRDAEDDGDCWAEPVLPFMQIHKRHHGGPDRCACILFPDGRVMDYGFCDQVAKLIAFGTTLGDSLENVAELKEMYETNEDAKQ